MQRQTRSGTGTLRRRTSQSPTENAAPGLSEDILRQIAVAPLFQVTSLNGRYWYDPYEGRPVATHGQPLDAIAERHLATLPRLRQRSPLAWRDLQFQRWLHELPHLLRHDPRFAVFGPHGQGWVDPFQGDWHPTVIAPRRQVNRDTLLAMAGILADRTGLALGEPLSVAELSRCRPLQNIPPLATKPTPEHRRTPSEQHHQEDLDDAMAVQHQQLARLPQLPGYGCAVHYQGQDGVSGDIYAVLPYGEHRYLVLIGDVTGHGVQAALIVGPLLKTIRLLSDDHPDPVTLLSRVNDEIKGDLLAGQFVTLAVAVLQTDTNLCEVVLAGHHPFAIINPAHEHPVHRVGRTGMALGLTTGELFRSSLRPIWITLQEGDTLVQCTDGVLEAQDDNDREYGLHRFWGSALAHAQEPPRELVRLISADASRFSAGAMGDDVCVLALARPVSDPERPTRTTARTVYSQPRMAAAGAGDDALISDSEDLIEVT